MPELYKRNPNSHCVICNKPVYKRPWQVKKNKGKVYCGQSCYGISCRKEIPCVICKTPILGGLHKKTCSRACANKNRAKIKHHGIVTFRDKVKEIRAIKLRLLKNRGKTCERCDYHKYEILQVHHIDKNKHNNKVGNLELICPNCHAEEHFLKKSWLKKVKI